MEGGPAQQSAVSEELAQRSLVSEELPGEPEQQLGETGEQLLASQQQPVPAKPEQPTAVLGEPKGQALAPWLQFPTEEELVQPSSVLVRQQRRAVPPQLPALVLVLVRLEEWVAWEPAQAAHRAQQPWKVASTWSADLQEERPVV
jgi:hypothetical protein